MRAVFVAALLASAGCFDFESLGRLYHPDGGVPDLGAPDAAEDGAVADLALADLVHRPRDLTGADLIPESLLFTPQTPCINLGTNQGLDAIAVFDGDGANGPDLVVGAGTTKTVYTLFGDSAGTSFAGSSTITLTSIVQGVAGGDFDGDGFPDLIAHTLSDVYLMHGMAGNSYGGPSSIATGSAFYAITSGRFDNDTHLDAAWIDSSLASITIATQGSAIGFTQSTKPTGSGPVAIAAYDLNGDGALDLAVANQGNDTVKTYINNGSGTFGAGATITLAPSTQQPIRMAVGDLDGDTVGDLVIITNQQQMITVLNMGNGTFNAPNLPVDLTGLGVEGVVIADFNNDGRGDVAYTSYSTGNVYTAPGAGDGTFAPARSWATCSQPSAIVAADFNRDQKIDIAVTCSDSSSDVCEFVNATP